MKYTVLTALLSFGIGVYVGKPAEIIVKTEGIKDCTIIQKEYEPISSAGGSVTEALKKVEALHHPQEAAPTPQPSDDNAKNAEVIAAASPSPEPELPSDEKPIPDGKAWAKDEVDFMARMTLQNPQGVHNYTFSTVEYAHIDEFRAELAAQGLVILKEGPPAVGKWVWYMQIVGPSYVVPTPEKD